MRDLVPFVQFKKQSCRNVTFSKVTAYITHGNNIRRNVNSDLSVVTMRGVAITFFKLGIVKKLIQKF